LRLVGGQSAPADGAGTELVAQDLIDNRRA
jgi:hypothetical protein